MSACQYVIYYISRACFILRLQATLYLVCLQSFQCRSRACIFRQGVNIPYSLILYSTLDGCKYFVIKLANNSFYFYSVRCRMQSEYEYEHAMNAS